MAISSCDAGLAPPLSWSEKLGPRGVASDEEDIKTLLFQVPVQDFGEHVRGAAWICEGPVPEGDAGCSSRSMRIC